MADVNLAAIKLGTLYSDKVGRSLRYNSKVLAMLPVKAGRSGSCVWSIDGYGSSAGFAATESMSFASTETARAQIGFSQAWAHPYASRKISFDSIDIAAATANPLDNANLLVDNMSQCFQDIVQAMGTGVFTGAGTSGTLLGLDNQLIKTGTSAGVNRDTPANLPARAYVVDPGSPTALTLQQIRTDVLAITDVCGRKPHVAVCGSGVYSKVLALFDGNAQYHIDVRRPDGVIRFDAGAEAIRVQQVDFVLDPNAPSGSIYYLNLDEICVRVVPSATGNEVKFGFDSLGMPIALPCRMNYLPADGLFMRMALDLLCQLEVSTPSCHGVRRNVTV